MTNDRQSSRQNHRQRLDHIHIERDRMRERESIPNQKRSWEPKYQGFKSKRNRFASKTLYSYDTEPLAVVSFKFNDDGILDGGKMLTFNNSSSDKMNTRVNVGSVNLATSISRSFSQAFH